jgi:wyosine [tRNA(Phe)-imidazoG37] synthetase (radical SAM superfamily)
MKSRIIYGPILSRRLGRSLGIDVIKKLDAKKNCTGCTKRMLNSTIG